MSLMLSTMIVCPEYKEVEINRKLFYDWSIKYLKFFETCEEPLAGGKENSSLYY